MLSSMTTTAPFDLMLQVHLQSLAPRKRHTGLLIIQPSLAWPVACQEPKILSSCGRTSSSRKMFKARCPKTDLTLMPSTIPRARIRAQYVFISLLSDSRLTCSRPTPNTATFSMMISASLTRNSSKFLVKRQNPSILNSASCSRLFMKR